MITLAYVSQRKAAKAAEAKLRRGPKQNHIKSRSDTPSTSSSSSSASSPPPAHTPAPPATPNIISKQSLRKRVSKTYKSRAHSVVTETEADSTPSDTSTSQDDVGNSMLRPASGSSPSRQAARSDKQVRQRKRRSHADNSQQADQDEPGSAKSSSSPLRGASKRSAAQAAQNSIHRACSDSIFVDAELTLPAQKKSRPSTSSRLPSLSRVKIDGEEGDGISHRAPLAKSKSKASSSNGALLSQNSKERRRYRDDQNQVWELQVEGCYAHRYKQWRKCVQCIRKIPGDTCRFAGFRAFPVDPITNELVSAGETSVLEPAFLSSSSPDEVMDLPSSRPLASESLRRAQVDVSRSLLSVLEAELTHAKQADTLRRPRETTCRQMCEFCATSIFSASWYCKRCGSEYCPDCKHAIEHPEDSDPAILKRITRCDRVRAHRLDDLVPLTRFDTLLLEQEAVAMRVMLMADGARGDLQQSFAVQATAAATTSSGSEKEDEIVVEWKKVPHNRAGLTADRIIGTHALRAFDAAAFDTELFRQEWSHGEPLLVRDVTAPMEHTSDPKALASRYGQESCLIVRSDTDLPETKQVSVGDFFSTFGQDLQQKEAILGKGSWKLKDWPPSAEFKHEFPELYKDFNLAVPAPEYTTREGVLNLASCYPTGVIQPDLGPKMYNAWPASEGVRGQGTTRLHMDIADAVNIMLYAAAPVEDDVPEEHRAGVAAWDIFRAEDADKLRAFLRSEHAKLKIQDDPIHTQRFFISAPQRVELFRKYGVKSWRIYQKPGEAVFIPAGCAHQVCNLTDCVKVAVDFVSPQNVERCFKLTAEFRELVKDYKKGWKEDVLSLRTTLWYAWCTYREMDGKGPNVWAKEHKIQGEALGRVTKKVLQVA